MTASPAPQGKPMIFAGSASRGLAERIAQHMKLPLGKAELGRFSDGEIQVQLRENVRGQDVFVVQSTPPPADNMLELLLMADALRRSSAARITAVIPYFGYSRQDRRVRSARVPISASVVASTLVHGGVDRVMTVELHSEQIQGFFDIPVDNLYTSGVFAQHLRKQHPDLERLTVVTPDAGGIVRARALAQKLDNRDLVIVDKRRPSPNQSEVVNVIGNVADRICAIVDDIVDTAGTLCNAAAALKREGATRVVACCSHALLSGDARGKLEASELDELIVCDTLEGPDWSRDSQRIQRIGMAPTIAEAIHRMGASESISRMFE